MNKTPLQSRATLTRLRHLSDEGIFSREAWERACAIAGHTPTLRDWWLFINRALLVVGVLFIIAGAVLMSASNFREPPRFVMFGALQAGIVLAAVAVRFFGIDSLPGKLALLVAALLTSGLLISIEQEYQIHTRIDRLMLLWSLLVAGWVFISRWGPLWVLWYTPTSLGLVIWWGIERSWSEYATLPIVIGLSSVLLAAWEYGNLRGIHWLAARWIPRLIALFTLGISTYYIMFFIFPDYESSIRYLAPPLYIMIMVVFVWFYSQIQRELLILAVCGFSLVVISLALLVRFGEITELFDDTWGYSFALVFAGGLVLAETFALVRTLRYLQVQWEDD